jgi:hypothetical protein
VVPQPQPAAASAGAAPVPQADLLRGLPNLDDDSNGRAPTPTPHHSVSNESYVPKDPYDGVLVYEAADAEAADAEADDLDDIDIDVGDTPVTTAQG